MYAFGFLLYLGKCKSFSSSSYCLWVFLYLSLWLHSCVNVLYRLVIGFGTNKFYYFYNSGIILGVLYVYCNWKWKQTHLKAFNKHRIVIQIKTLKKNLKWVKQDNQKREVVIKNLNLRYYYNNLWTDAKKNHKIRRDISIELLAVDFTS